MKRRLFLTGPMGCGKSTAIARALEERLTQCGGFLTRRCREPHLHFTLETPDGSKRAVFLDFSGSAPTVTMEVFSTLGSACLSTRAPMVLDEIGGIELLVPEFAAALDTLLSRDVPVLGVLKGEGPAGALVESLGLTEEYRQAARRLHRRLRKDPDTLVYECTQFDEQALVLARQWAEEYLHDTN